MDFSLAEYPLIPDIRNVPKRAIWSTQPTLHGRMELIEKTILDVCCCQRSLCQLMNKENGAGKLDRIEKSYAALRTADRSAVYTTL